MLRVLVLVAVTACAHATTPVATPDLVLEITPVKLGVHPPGELPELTVAIVNHSAKTFVLPKPHRLAHEGAGTFYYEYELAHPDGTWEPQSRTWFLNDSLPDEDPHAIFEIKPGERVVLDNAGVPPLTFADDVVGTMRAHLVYDVDAEWTRRAHPAPHVGKIVSNTIELAQTGGPFEVKLEQIGPIVVGRPLDLPHVLRVTVRNRSNADITILGPGEHSGMGFDIDTPNGGVWPKGDRPVMDVAPGEARTQVLHPNETVEMFGPHAALGDEPGTWTYPVAESFRLRANFYQPTPQRFHYSDWVTLTAVAP